MYFLPWKGLDLSNFVIDTSGMLKRKSLAVAVLVPMIVGSIGLMNLMQRPGFDSFRTVDVIQLLASGMCFGVALSAVVALLRGTRAA